MEFLKKNILICIIAIITIISGIYFMIEQKTSQNNIVIENTNLEENDDEIIETKKDNKIEDDTIEENKIYVYVTGEVKNNGIVILNNGARISDAIEAAGGLTENADISEINMVYELQDGIKLSIPNKQQIEENEKFNYIITNSNDNQSEETIIKNTSENKENNDLININNATQTELETLPGIGPSLALNIINYRKENGRFSSIDEIKNVKGIGDSKYENIKRYICI